MTVTEFAILPLASAELNPDFSAIATRCVQVQEKWFAQHQASPSIQSAIPERGTWIFQQVEDPRAIMLVARWASVDAHHKWIASEENQAGMGELMPHIATPEEMEKDPARRLVVFHLDSDVFSVVKSADGTDRRPLLESPVISVMRLQNIASEKRARLNDVWPELKALLEGFDGVLALGNGWRIDKEDPEKEEFVTFVGWPSIEVHQAIVKSPDFDKFAVMRELASDWSINHYQRILH